MSSDRERAPGSVFVLAFFLLWTFGWTFGVLLFDGVMGYRMARQVLTVRYASGSGTITQSEMTHSSDSDGTSYKFQVRYVYEVNGREYAGSQVSHSAFDGFASPGEPRALAKRFPTGATVPVFYRPEAPEVSVLLKGLQGSDLFFLMFITPFNLIMFSSWYSLGWLLRGGTRRSGDLVGTFSKEGRTHVPLTGESQPWTLFGGGLSKMFTGFLGDRGGPSIKGRAHALLAEMSPLEAGLRVLGAACIVGCLVAGALTEFAAPMPVMLSSWGVVIAITLTVALWHRARLRAGTFDLIVDEERERISLPSSNYKHRLDLAWSQLQSVALEEHVAKDGFGRTVWTTWRPTVTFTHAGGESEKVILANWRDQERAEALVSWLRQRVGLERSTRST